MSFAFANKLGVSVSKSYNNPYDAFQNQNLKHELCLVSDNRVIRILDTEMISVKWAVSCAKYVLHIFEEQYPDDKRPRKAIEAASNWIKDPSIKNKEICKSAANASRYIAFDASNTSGRIIRNAAYSATDAACAASCSDVHIAVNASFSAFTASLAVNDASDIKWQLKKLNKIVYEDIIVLLVKSQYQRINKKLVRKIPKELLEYIASFLY